MGFCATYAATAQPTQQQNCTTNFVYFATGSHELTPEEQDHIRNVAAMIRSSGLRQQGARGSGANALDRRAPTVQICCRGSGGVAKQDGCDRRKRCGIGSLWRMSTLLSV